MFAHPSNKTVICGGVLVTRQHTLTTLRCALLIKRLQLVPRRLQTASLNLPPVFNNASTNFQRDSNQSLSTDITVSGKQCLKCDKKVRQVDLLVVFTTLFFSFFCASVRYPALFPAGWATLRLLGY